MWILSLTLMTLWMALELLGITGSGLTSLVLLTAVALELFRRPGPRCRATHAR